MHHRGDRLKERAICLVLGLSTLGAVRGSHLSPPERRQVTAFSSTAAATATPAVTALSACHLHGTAAYCMSGTTEYQVLMPTPTSDLPETLTDCHLHGSEMFCMDANGEDVEVVPENANGAVQDAEHGDAEHEGHEHEGDTDNDTDKQAAGEMDCHFHAGVEHCVPRNGQASEAEGQLVCERQDRDYNVRLRIGLLFVILVTSFIGVAAPIFLAPALPAKFDIVLSVIKQFGTGIIISTAFVHLFTHASLLFASRCLGVLEYEATAAAFLMAGLFLSFLIEYFGHRLGRRMKGRRAGAKAYNADLVSVLILEAGIIFHSLLIGLTLVVAGDSVFITLFVVILFHQVFEGMALGSRIAAVKRASGPETETETRSAKLSDTSEASPSPETLDAQRKPLPIGKRLIMASAFALVTPAGMAIGIGVLHRFNGNDPSTIWAIGTLDALSAGILAWVGIYEMLARDWMDGGDLAHAGAFKTGCSLFGLVAGFVAMSVLGKWA